MSEQPDVNPTDGASSPAPDAAADGVADAVTDVSEEVTEPTDLEIAEALAAERTADLQRLQAEYANYKKRVDRDRSMARELGIEAVILDLLPVLDSIEAARAHDEVTGGFKLVAEELERVGSKFGLTMFGEVGEVFDPQLHEALMHMPYEGEHDEIVIAAVIQKGVKLGERVIRPARVGVADPS